MSDSENAPPPVPKYPRGGPDEAVATVIPYRNPYALAAYYLGIFSFIPIVGVFLGGAAFVLGILGFRHARREQGAHGRVHALIGIGCGGVFFLVNAVLIGAIIVFVLAAPSDTWE